MLREYEEGTKFAFGLFTIFVLVVEHLAEDLSLVVLQLQSCRGMIHLLYFPRNNNTYLYTSKILHLLGIIENKLNAMRRIYPLLSSD